MDILNKKNLDLVKEEFDNDRRRWTDIIFQRIFYYSDLKIKLAEREFQFILFLTTISVAFLTLILPLVLTAGYKITNIAIFGFLISSALGFIRVILSIIIDKIEISKDEDFELNFFQKCQKLAMEIYNSSLDKAIDNQKIKEYFDLGGNARKLASQREKEKYPFNLTLSIIYYLFLLSFTISFVSLFYEIICYLWYIQ